MRFIGPTRAWDRYNARESRNILLRDAPSHPFPPSPFRRPVRFPDSVCPGRLRPPPPRRSRTRKGFWTRSERWRRVCTERTLWPFFEPRSPLRYYFYYLLILSVNPYHNYYYYCYGYNRVLKCTKVIVLHSVKRVCRGCNHKGWRLSWHERTFGAPSRAVSHGYNVISISNVSGTWSLYY